ncbi:MAG: amidohydrolase family protein, partial [Persicimonas sp.]
MSDPIIDAWIQHPTADFINHEMFASLRRWMGLDGELERDIPVEMTAGAMEAAGVTRALVSAWWGPQGPIISNEEVADIVEARPDLFVGVGSVDLSRPMRAVRQVKRCVEDFGFAAIRALPWLWDLPPDDRRYYPVYAACVEHDIPFC